MLCGDRQPTLKLWFRVFLIKIWHWWLMYVILATREAEIGRITV
jgi:hypothetical protein